MMRSSVEEEGGPPKRKTPMDLVGRDRLFADPKRSSKEFVFDEEVAEVFDDMLERSIPFYRQQQEMIREMLRRFWIPGTAVYDLGCSTGTLLVELASVLEDARLVGLDNSVPMIDRARRNAAEHGLMERIELVVADLNGHLEEIPLENASVVTLCWTLQFIQPLHRDDLIRWIHDKLVDGGVLVVTEKVLAGNGSLDRLFIDFYYDFKRRNGYSEIEIARKREALQNVLVPYRVKENLELFRRCGFGIVDTFFQWYNFAGFLCTKRPAF